MGTIQLSEVVNEIRQEKNSIYKHIKAIERILDNVQGEEKLTSLYLELSPKLSRYYALLQKHNEQLLESIKIYYKEMGGDSNGLNLEDL